MGGGGWSLWKKRVVSIENVKRHKTPSLFFIGCLNCPPFCEKDGGGELVFVEKKGFFEDQ